MIEVDALEENLVAEIGAHGVLDALLHDFFQNENLLFVKSQQNGVIFPDTESHNLAEF